MFSLAQDDVPDPNIPVLAGSNNLPERKVNASYSAKMSYKGDRNIFPTTTSMDHHNILSLKKKKRVVV